MRIGDLNPLSIASSLIGVGGGGSSGTSAAASNPISVAPSFQTAISPQISPVFVQTGAGSTGAVSAGTSMSAGTAQGAPKTAAAAPFSDIGYPGGDIGTPTYPYAPPSVVQTSNWQQYVPYAFGAIALVAVLSVMKNRKA